ncbi:hypothetical protein AVEN_184856-1, partial [Araneus ventricosus]
MLVFRRGEMSQPYSDEFQPLWSEISSTYIRGAVRKCFRAKGRNTGLELQVPVFMDFLVWFFNVE